MHGKGYRQASYYPTSTYIHVILASSTISVPESLSLPVNFCGNKFIEIRGGSSSYLIRKTGTMTAKSLFNRPPLPPDKKDLSILYYTLKMSNRAICRY